MSTGYTTGSLRRAARHTLAAKAARDPRYDLLLLQMMLRTGLDRSQIELGIERLARGI